jgi:hypothetical protein
MGGLELNGLSRARHQSIFRGHMKRRWNHSIWAGFLFVLAGLVTYVPLFALFPLTRDFPWVNLLLFAAGAFFLGAGLRRAYRQPDVYRGRFLGPSLALLSLAGISFFCYGLFYVVRQLPAAEGAPRVGQKAPEFTLPDQNGKAVTLAELLTSATAETGGAPAKGALLIFYRGHW